MDYEDRITIYPAIIHKISMAKMDLSDEDRAKVKDATEPGFDMAALKKISTNIYRLYSVLDYCIYERKYIHELASIEEIRETALDALRRYKQVNPAVLVRYSESYTDVLEREKQKICDQIDRRHWQNKRDNQIGLVETIDINPLSKYDLSGSFGNTPNFMISSF